MDNKTKNIILIIAGLIIIVLACYISIDKTINNKYEVKLIDTVYNHIVLDSIQYNIIKKDSIIYNYKEQMYEEIKKNNDASTDDVVRTFYQLVAE